MKANNNLNFENVTENNQVIEILEDGTKINCLNHIAYIVGNNEESSEEDLSDLNYYVKYALENESYDELLERIKNEDNWYDDMLLHNMFTVVND